MTKIKWTNTRTGQSDFVRGDKGVRTYRTEKAASTAIKRFEKFAPEEICYEVVR